MTKRHCFVTDVGDAIEALATSLYPERNPPFKGDILDLLEWATKDVLELRKQLDAISEEFGLPKGIGPAPGEIKRILSGLRQQLAEHVYWQDQLRQQVTLLREFATKISKQIPEKPDHWSSCSQCEYNSSDAEDIIEALAATEPK